MKNQTNSKTIISSLTIKFDYTLIFGALVAINLLFPLVAIATTTTIGAN